MAIYVLHVRGWRTELYIACSSRKEANKLFDMAIDKSKLFEKRFNFKFGNGGRIYPVHELNKALFKNPVRVEYEESSGFGPDI